MIFSRPSSKHGFSLLELSIVLVVVALLAGLVVAGQEVILNSKIQSVVKDLNRFQSALDAFKTKYKAIPGDMPNAEDFWGTDATGGGTLGCPESTAGRGVVKVPTCNGNGSGKLDTLATATWARGHENFRFWQHLGNADLLQEKFSGTDSTACFGCADAPTNVPMSKLRNGYYHVVEFGMAGDLSRFSGYMGLTIYAASVTSGAGFLLPSEVAYIDQKLDDGKPGTGKIQAGKPTGDAWPTCTTTNSAVTSVYANHRNAICGFYYLTGY